MRILFVTSRVPYPPFRGDKLKIFNLIKNLSREHEIVLVTFLGQESDREQLPALRKYCTSIHAVYHPLWKSLARCAVGTLGARPLQVEWFRSKTMTEVLAGVIWGQPFDVVHTHLIRLAQYTHAWESLPRILDLTDAVSLYLHRFMQTEKNPLKKLGLRMERDRVRRYESILNSFDCSLVCSEVDKKELGRSVPGARVEILENGVDLEYFTPRRGSVPRTNTVIFTGNMSYFPNEDGARYFVHEILPLIRREVPDVQFSIVGQHPPKSVLCLADGFKVKVTGAVEDIRTYYLQNAVAVSPVRFGAGTLNKVLEPMAMGIPVVSSGVGMEGLPMKADEHFLMAPTAEQFAAAVVLLLRDKQRADGMAELAMHLVRNRYGWEVITNRLTHYYEEVRELHRSSRRATRATSAR